MVLFLSEINQGDYIMLEFMVRLQEIRTPLLNKIVELITITGEEYVLIVVMCIIFWCVSREHGYKMILSIVLASASNAVLKMIFNVERPWVKDERIIPIRQETATGSSMPSGHTQVGSSMWFSMSRSFRKRFIIVICYTMMILLAVSRVYLGVHTPQDVLAGLALSVVGVLIAHYVMDKAEKNDSIRLLLLIASLSFIGLFFCKDESYYKMTGLLLALPLAFFLENKYVKFKAKTKLPKQILKVALGFIVVLIFKEGLKIIFPESLIFGTVRYFFVGMSAIYLVPKIFVTVKLSESDA